MEKYFEIKVPFEDDVSAKMFGEVLHALHAGYYAGAEVYKYDFVVCEELSSIDEGFEVPEKYSVFYRIIIAVQNESQARHLARIIGYLSEVLLGEDGIFYNFSGCID